MCLWLGSKHCDLLTRNRLLGKERAGRCTDRPSACASTFCGFILHGSKVSLESDLCSVPYNRTVGVRSFVKNVKLLSENQHNS